MELQYYHSLKYSTIFSPKGFFVFWNGFTINILVTKRTEIVVVTGWTYEIKTSSHEDCFHSCCNSDSLYKKWEQISPLKTNEKKLLQGQSIVT